MTYYHTQRGVRDYIEMAEGIDGAALIKVLRKYLPAGSTVLELGMGPGKDLALLEETYSATGSDYSPLFLDLYRRSHPCADLLLLDAATIETDRHFDGVYSNKVLHHLTREQLAASLTRQVEVLCPGGIALHSFWHGAGNDEVHEGLLFVYHTVGALQTMATVAGYQVLEIAQYAELAEGDSLYVALRSRGAKVMEDVESRRLGRCAQAMSSRGPTVAVEKEKE